jgi:primosomal protein N' (replication factor Y)
VRGIDSLLNKSWIALIPSSNANIEFQKPRRTVTVGEDDGQMPRDGILPTDTLPKIDSSWKAHIAHCLQSDHMKKLVLHAPWEHRLSRLADAIHQAHSMKRSTLVLTGEIARASWLTQQLSRLTDLQITHLHNPLDGHRARGRLPR